MRLEYNFASALNSDGMTTVIHISGSDIERRISKIHRLDILSWPDPAASHLYFWTLRYSSSSQLFQWHPSLISPRKFICLPPRKSEGRPLRKSDGRVCWGNAFVVVTLSVQVPM